MLPVATLLPTLRYTPVLPEPSVLTLLKAVANTIGIASVAMVEQIAVYADTHHRHAQTERTILHVAPHIIHVQMAQIIRHLAIPIRLVPTAPTIPPPATLVLHHWFGMEVVV